MRKLTLSTAVKAPKVLLTLSMTTCGFASGSSHGRSAVVFCCDDSTRTRLLELRRRRCPAAVGSEERTLHHLCTRHSTLPHEFSVQIDVRPDRRSRPEIRRIDHSKRDIALASR